MWRGAHGGGSGGGDRRAWLDGWVGERPADIVNGVISNCIRLALLLLLALVYILTAGVRRSLVATAAAATAAARAVQWWQQQPCDENEAKLRGKA